MNIEDFKYLCLTEIKMLFVVRNRRSSACDILCIPHKISQFLNDLMTFISGDRCQSKSSTLPINGTDELSCGTINTLII